MKNGFEHTQEAIKERGEVFTPTTLANDMLDKLPKSLFKDRAKTFLDNSCGNGQFLFLVLQRKMANGIPHGVALSTIYGVELDPKNAQDCRDRLLMGSTDVDLINIVNNNIICADALDPNHSGWRGVGYMWEPEEWFHYSSKCYSDRPMPKK